MRQSMMMKTMWVEGFRLEKRPYRQNRVDGFGSRVWKLGWGLLFIVAMTVLSEWGPHAAFSKVPPAPAMTEQAVHAVK